MAFFGTSKSDEEALRAAAQQGGLQQSESNPSLHRSASSAYETASEFTNDDISQVDPASIADNEHFDRYSEAIVNDHGPSHNHDDRPSTAQGTAVDDDEDNIKSFRAPSNDNVDYSNMTENELNRIATTSDTLSNLEREVTRQESRDGLVDPKDLDWDSRDDKANPQNWPLWKKWFITLSVAVDCLCVSLGSSLYVEAVPELQVKMGISQTLGIAGLTFYLIGLALGPVFASPISEVIGRRWIYIVSLPLSMLFTMGVGLAKNIRTVLVLRFFAGYFGSPPMAIAGGTVSDLWGNSPPQMSIAMAFFCVAAFLGPVVGPILGGFAAEHKNWQWTQWVSLMFSGAVLPLLCLCPETFKPAILKKRAIARGIKLEKPKLTWPLVKTMLTVFLFRPAEMLVVEPIVCLTSFYIAFVFAVLFGFFEAFPIIFRGIYGMGIGVSGLPFIGVGVGLITGVACYIALDHIKFFPKNPDGTRGNFDEDGNPIWDAPESRLLVAEVGSIFLPVALFWLAWTARESIHWIVPTLAGIPFGFGLIWVFFGIVLYYSMAYPPQYVASALAANNLLRYILASVFPLFVFQMYERLHVDWATSTFAFIAVAMVPIPFAFHKFGPTIRQRSKYGYAAYFKRLAAEKKAREEEKAAKQGQEKFVPSNDISSDSEDNQKGGSPYDQSSRTENDAEKRVAEAV
ncbi:hypothetical protein FT663_04478 [Candidozyma haemuli var. vulneris]|uniref:Major facilitator superfamily (MFS) profile domain-containing protein n=1 Tax=Candidozyma haemuli TaxID=45357 RepID=A0A2V1AQB8_9ASCO|nr:hypothetical protein CXQ85_001827 [[Candida] haemuloni]KAF3987383.1 hypothetical protein FT663_04478 [[Candida] haemuloni var. vulneris]KAF3993153.1 hypothetical protein FT662_00781 [[Candida] haemuloni var. vulneris]PVH20048.1 hypothetical protein CXQ85_001827 [[Candida] haemuloni]